MTASSVSCVTPDRAPDALTAASFVPGDECERAIARQPAAAAAAVRCEAIFSDRPAREKIVFDGTTEQLKLLYRKMEFDVEWRNNAENELNYLQFIRKQDLITAAERGDHPVNRYGIEHYQAFVRARSFLREIPQGEFRLTPELIQKVHSLAYGKDIPPGGLLTGYSGESYSALEPSPYKKRNNYGGDPMKNPVGEEAYQALKSNKWLKGFKEAPWPFSREGSRRGVIQYGEYSEVPQKMKELIDWVEANKGKMDPIELAATFQHAFVSIHPFVDGNGRTSMLLMNRLLSEHDLPPMIFSNTTYDIYMTPKQWAAEVRKGVQEFIELAERVEYKDLPAVARNNFADSPNTFLLPQKSRSRKRQGKLSALQEKIRERLKWMEDDLVPDSRRKILSIGGRQFLLLPDGFFYSQHGIPHAVHEGKLYPVADRTYFLYAERGEARATRFSRRRLNPVHRELISGHLKMMRAAEEGRTDLSKIEVQDYSLIAEANRKGEVFLYPWQRAVFERAIDIRDGNPFDVLAGTRGYNTNFERSVEFGMKISADEVVAQYQLMDLKFQEYARFAEKTGDAGWLRTIESSRGKLFDAAKDLLAVVEKNLHDRLKTPEELEALGRQGDWMLFRRYVEHTPLKYATFREAMEHAKPGKIVVLRSDMTMAGRIGFRSNQSYVELAKSLPGYETFKAWVSANAGALKAKKPPGLFTKAAAAVIPGFDALIPRIAKVLDANRYDFRLADRQFDREFVDHYLHSVNSPLKEGISFSTATGLYIRFEELPDGTRVAKLPFTFEGQSSSLYFVEVDVGSQVTVNTGTKYMRQYELLAFEKVSSDRIVETVRLNELTDAGDPPKSVRDFLGDGFYVRPPAKF